MARRDRGLSPGHCKACATPPTREANAAFTATAAIAPIALAISSVAFFSRGLLALRRASLPRAAVHMSQSSDSESSTDNGTPEPCLLVSCALELDSGTPEPCLLMSCASELDDDAEGKGAGGVSSVGAEKGTVWVRTFTSSSLSESPPYTLNMAAAVADNGTPETTGLWRLAWHWSKSKVLQQVVLYCTGRPRLGDGSCHSNASNAHQGCTMCEANCMCMHWVKTDFLAHVRSTKQQG